QDSIYKSIMSDVDIDYELSQSVYDIEAFYVDQWKADIINDIAIFESMLKLLPNEKKFHKYDDKLHVLHGILESRSGQKILLFTESLKTAVYVYDYLEKNMPGTKIGHIDSLKSPRTKKTLVNRFDPINNNASIPPEGQLDILISTDVLSEGVNLQAGRIVINYDFHWNPVRLIQRVGRIDRIGSEHHTVDVINFLPTSKIEQHLGLKERVANKIETIRKIIGHDQKILEESEKIDKNAVIDIYSGQDSVLDDTPDGILDVIQTASELDAEKIRGDDKLKEKIESLPLGIRSATGSGRLLVACEADEKILLDDDIIKTKTFRRYYSVEDDNITKMTASLFLKYLGYDSKKNKIQIDSSYGNMLNYAWRAFTRDVKDEQARKQTSKIQKYFERKLRDMAEDRLLGRRAKVLIPKITQMIVTNRQPYRSLSHLRKKINKDGLDDRAILEQLESIFKKAYGYSREIGRPRILYSMRTH
ncbi:MAG: SWF/SNF helicase family protein, partial [Cenarchaeum sp. SB0678_bin_8]|nr:SWF/SNF helicase family protein [Cenarchaeum sp. SB0678_bin_8]